MDEVLRLKKNLYGLKDADRAWWQHLSEGLEDMGFRKCETEQCVWVKNGVIIVVYVDDCLIFADKNETIKDIVTKMKQKDITA